MELIPKVHLVPGVTGGNVYLLVGDTLTLVDTGMPDNADAILGYVGSLGLDAAGLTRIFITHYHRDHVGSIAAIKRRTSSLVLAHPEDAPFISGEQAPPRPPISAMQPPSGVEPAPPQIEPAVVDVTLRDCDRLDVLRGATVVHVPGHTPGSIALHLPAEGVLICGDTIRNDGQRLTPPPAIYTLDMETAIASIRRMAALEFDVLCVGHGAPVVGGADEQVRALVRELG